MSRVRIYSIFVECGVLCERKVYCLRKGRKGTCFLYQLRRRHFLLLMHCVCVVNIIMDIAVALGALSGLFVSFTMQLIRQSLFYTLQVAIIAYIIIILIITVSHAISSLCFLCVCGEKILIFHKCTYSRVRTRSVSTTHLYNIWLFIVTNRLLVFEIKICLTL